MRGLRTAGAIGAALLLTLAAAGPSAAAPARRHASTPACTITGTSGDNVLEGTPADDVICGLGGNDVINGEGGNDTLIGGSGNDVLNGEDDNDTLIGGAGVDTCVQGDGVGAVSTCEALAPISFTIGDATGAEGNPGATNTLSFPVTLSTPVGVTTTVRYTTADGTATAPSDYTTESGTLSFAAGVTSRTITVPVTGDAVYEPDETFTVVLSNPSAGTLADASGTGTMTNDDPQYQLNIADAHAAESAGKIGFNVTLSPPSTSDVYVQYATVDGTATAPADYAGAIGVLEFPAGIASKKVSFPVVDDAIDEPDETFKVVLSNPVGATITDGTAVGTILASDPTNLPTLTVANASSLEGNKGGSNALNFKATLDEPSGYTIDAVADVTLGTALYGYDYLYTTVVAEFTPGQTHAVFSLPIRGDTTPEHNETLSIRVRLNSLLATSGQTATGTIRNDDPGLIIDGLGPRRQNVAVSTSVSANGRFVAAVTTAVSHRTAYGLLSVYDRTLGKVIASQSAPGYSSVSISGDGTFVAFENAGSGISRWSLANGSTTVVNSARRPALDGDGDLVAFTPSTGGVSLHQFSTATTTPITTDAGASLPAISADGSHVAYAAGDGTIHVYTVATATTVVASVATDGTAADAPSYEPALNADGTVVGFSSAATNLVAGDANASTDVFRRDLATSTTTRVSVANDGGELAAGGASPSISGDGSEVSFVGGDGELSVRKIDAGTTTSIVSSAIGATMLSSDGQTLAFASTLVLVDGPSTYRRSPQPFVATL